MSKNAFIKKEGISMNATNNFGDPAPLFSEFTCFLILENVDWRAKFYYYYRITNDNYIQIAQGYDNEVNQICAQFKKTDQDIKSNLEKIMSRYFEAYRGYEEFPEFVESSLFTKQDFKEILEFVNTEADTLINIAKKNPSPFIEFLKTNNFNPKPSGNSEYSWKIGCPNAKGRHFLMISTLNDEWGCGYCRKKGNLEEFKNWLRELDKKHLTKPVKEINSTNTFLDKIKKWRFYR